MIKIKAFRALRPSAEHASEVADLPYDVVTNEEVRNRLKTKPYSFLKVDKPEAWCKEIDEASVARAAGEALTDLITQHILIEEEKPSLYIYGLESKWGRQYGIVGCFACKQYEEGVIKKHEKTRADKEADRVRHVEACQAHTGPIFLTCKADTLQVWIDAYRGERQPLYDFTEDTGLRQVIYRIDEAKHIEEVTKHFEVLDALYVADGHHRLQAAATYAKQARVHEPVHGCNHEEASDYFLGVVFPKSELTIIDYNRVLKDESGLSEQRLMEKLADSFHIMPIQAQVFKPQTRHTFGMRYKKKWYALQAHSTILDEQNVVQCLDTSILQTKVLAPIFQIENPRTDTRIDFVGGVKGIEVLNQLTDEEWDVAFSLYPTSIEEMIAVADQGALMPPKSTWFEPKLRSGLFIHWFEKESLCDK